jgi:hypothetical protein
VLGRAILIVCDLDACGGAGVGEALAVADSEGCTIGEPPEGRTLECGVSEPVGEGCSEGAGSGGDSCSAGDIGSAAISLGTSEFDGFNRSSANERGLAAKSAMITRAKSAFLKRELDASRMMARVIKKN